MSVYKYMFTVEFDESLINQYLDDLKENLFNLFKNSDYAGEKLVFKNKETNEILEKLHPENYTNKDKFNVEFLVGDKVCTVGELILSKANSNIYVIQFRFTEGLQK